MRSSAAFLELHSGVATPLFVDAAGKTWHPLLAEVLTQRRNWGTPKAKKEPVTSRMFSVMAQLLDADVRRDPATHLEEFAALADWCFLGIHTGSRLGEYGQSTGGCVDPHVFNRVPFVAEAGIWAGTPLAFMAADFFFTIGTGVSLSIGSSCPVPGQPSQLLRCLWAKWIFAFAMIRAKPIILCANFAPCPVTLIAQ